MLKGGGGSLGPVTQFKLTRHCLDQIDIECRRSAAHRVHRFARAGSVAKRFLRAPRVHAAVAAPTRPSVHAVVRKFEVPAVDEAPGKHFRVIYRVTIQVVP